MEEHGDIPTSKKKTGPKPKDLVTIEVTGYEVGRGPTKKVVFDADVYKLAAMGCNDREIARWFDIKDRKSTRLNSSHIPLSRMPSSA